MALRDFAKEIKIDRWVIAEDAPPFLIAEAGVNHNGEMPLARRLIEAAADAGVQAVKFQAFRTEHLILKQVTKADYQQRTTDPKESQFEMLKKLELTREQLRELKQYAESKGLLFLVTPFDEVSLAELDDFDLAAYKVASTDITNLPFLSSIAAKKKPILLSTGMSYLDEIRLALEEISRRTTEVVLLHCTADYPAKDDEVNLRVLDTYRSAFGVLVGYSDHTEGLGASPFAAALGACVLEKHFTLDKSLPGPDHKASLDPSELAAFSREIARARRFLGTAVKMPSASEQRVRLSLQKALVAAAPIKPGEPFTELNLVAKRTGGRGISPIYYRSILGTPATRAYAIDDIIEEPQR